MTFHWKQRFTHLLAAILFSASLAAQEAATPAADGYTINYNTVSMVEYLKFASKICNTNFIFDEDELQFNVTVVSDAPITPENVMSTLLQVLRIHNLSLLEQGKDMVIHNNDAVRQPASLVIDNATHPPGAPIVTRIFRIKNANVGALAGILKPMISAKALLEVSVETRQLILTDVASSVERAAILIENLDSPYTPLEIATYEGKVTKSTALIAMATQIMHPIAQGNPLIFVPHTNSNTIFIVSTPELIQKTITILTNLDMPPKQGTIGFTGEATEVLVLPIESRSAQDVLKDLQDIAARLQDAAFTEEVGAAKVIPESNSLMFIGSPATNAKIKDYISSLDSPSLAEEDRTSNSFFIYKPQGKAADELAKSMQEFADNLSAHGVEPDVVHAIKNQKVNLSTNTILYSGHPASFARIKELLALADIAVPGSKQRGLQKNNFFVYKIQNASQEDLLASLKSFARNLEKSQIDPSIVSAIDNVKPIKETNSLLFTGPDDAIKRIQELLPQFDAGISRQMLAPSSQFFIYKPKALTGEQLLSSLKDIEGNLKSSGLADPSLLRTIASAKWVKTTQSLLFTGDPGSIQQVEDLLDTLDLPTSAQAIAAQKNFIVYPIKYESEAGINQYLDQIAGNLTKERTDPDLVNAISKRRWVTASHSFMFSGSDAALAKVSALLDEFDTSKGVPNAFILYQLKYVSQAKADQYLDQLANNLTKKGTDPALVEAIRARKWIEASQSYMFSGSQLTLSRVNDLLASFDIQPQEGARTGYFVYKLKNASGDEIEDDLENLLRNMKSTGLKNSPLVSVIENMRYVKETNSILLTGDPDAVEEVKSLIDQYDTPRATSGPAHTNFFIYKPQNVSAQSLQSSLKDIATNFRKAGLADPPLLNAVDSMKYVETTNSLIFTGTPDAIQKLQAILEETDVPPKQHAPIQHVGKTTYLLYKLQHASGPQIMASLKSILADLKTSSAVDKDFLSALSSMKYVKETNSLMFTGTEEGLTKVQALVEKFDVSSMGQQQQGVSSTESVQMPTASDFLLYKPQSVPGPELEKTLLDFEQNLKMSGLNDPGLFNAINSMKYVEKTQSLVFTGDRPSLAKVKVLLVDFDIPSNVPQGAESIGGPQPIQAIDNTSFLVYKLQFHKGDEIQSALRQIARDLTASNAPVNQSLMNAINSIQWLEVTNSLLCSGDQETLTRLRELIKNLDIPLKQVFIEILVVQTNLQNVTSFGLQWAGKLKYKDKFSGSFNNIAPGNETGTFFNNLTSINATATPNPTMIPFTGDFDLGVIGDIIMHKGQSFLSLGSLLDALQTDTASTQVFTPKLVTQDGRPSTVFIGQNVPFAGSFVSNQGSNTVNSSNIEYRDIGFNLSVTPVLGNSDIITLDIALDNSTAANTSSGAIFTFNNGSASGITTNRNTMQTTVHVPDRHFLILTGYINNSMIKATTGIPCLGGIPAIGAAFTQENFNDNYQSIIIFMRPAIMHSPDDMREISRDQEDLFRSETRTPYLRENYDEAVDMFKLPDDE